MGCFPFLARVSNDAATFMHKCLFEHLLSVHVGRAAGSCGNAALNFLRNGHTAFTAVTSLFVCLIKKNFLVEKNMYHKSFYLDHF